MRSTPTQDVLRWDPDIDPDEDLMEFRLTYAGELLTFSTDERKNRERSLHVHRIRKEFHKQLKMLWQNHPALRQVAKNGATIDLYVGSGCPPLNQTFQHDGFNWLPLVTEENGLICRVDILMLRPGPPGEALFDIDNRLKTVFDALRMAKGPYELGVSTNKGQVTPTNDENPFYVVLQDDRLITHLSATTDTLLEPVPNTPRQNAVRLVVNVTIRPYRGFLETAGYS